jgi:cholesterol transport system auxiliary component
MQALEQTGGFRAVVQAPSAVPADLRLDTELIRLQQNFGTRPPQVEIALRAQLVDLRSRRVLATAEFEEVEPTTREDAYDGVIAANRALQRLLARLADFSAEQSGGR